MMAFHDDGLRDDGLRILLIVFDMREKKKCPVLRLYYFLKYVWDTETTVV